MNSPAPYDEDQSRFEIAGSLIQSLFDKHNISQLGEVSDDTNAPDMSADTSSEKSEDMEVTQDSGSIGAVRDALESCY